MQLHRRPAHQAGLARPAIDIDLSAMPIDPWLAALPGVMIFITSMAFNLLADGVRSAMDIRR